VASGRVAADEVELKQGAIGAFEIMIDGELRYSKLKTHRFPEDSELDALL